MESICFKALSSQDLSFKTGMVTQSPGEKELPPFVLSLEPPFNKIV